MSIGTYLIIPARDPARTRDVVEAFESDATVVGRDFVVLLEDERFANVEEEPERFGAEFMSSLPSWMKKELDARGLAAYPEVGQAFDEGNYDALLEKHGEPLWLPLAPPKKRAARKKHTRVLLVGLSEARTKLLLAEPEMVRDLVQARAEAAIPGSLELSFWVELQRTLFDAMVLAGEDDTDRRADAVTPRGGVPLYEDKTVDGARIVRVSEVASTAEWLADLPEDVCARVRLMTTRSPSARAFPASLGASPTDDDALARTGSAALSEERPPLEEVERELTLLRHFYAELLTGRKALLSVRFRS